MLTVQRDSLLYVFPLPLRFPPHMLNLLPGSSACQIHGWNIQPSPHKHLCDLTKELKDAWAAYAPGATRILPLEGTLKTVAAEAGVELIAMDLWALNDHFKSLFGGSQLGGGSQKKNVDYKEGNDAMGFLGDLLSKGMLEKIENS